MLIAGLSLAPFAHADLYRWVDPQSGSVKFSSLPPSDPRVKAEVVTFGGAAAPKDTTATAPALEARWRRLLDVLTGLTAEDLRRGGEGLRQHLQAYEAVARELDRVDLSGAERRRKEAASLLEKLREGLAAQFDPRPPGSQ